MRVLVIGGGGREHAIAHTFVRQGHEIFCLPGNGGTQEIAQPIPDAWSDIDPNNFNQLIDFVNDQNIDLTVCGPEIPLSEGIADVFERHGKRFFGPTQRASQIESSKSWSKNFMQKYGLPTAKYVVCNDITEAKAAIESYFHVWGGVVVKPSGLTAGKGVVVCSTTKEAEDAVTSIMEEKVFGSAGKQVVIEETLDGLEVSMMVFCDGSKMVPMITSQDHKRLYDGGQGPNTGGIGAYSPTPFLSEEQMNLIERDLIERTSEGLKQEGILYKGFLYFGIMLTADGPKILEYNCRFGDPEAQAILPLLETDLASIMIQCCEGHLNSDDIHWKNQASCSVVLVSRGYPKAFQVGYPIEGLNEIKNLEGIITYHAGTRVDSRGNLVTSGGRVMTITAIADTLDEAIERCYRAVEKVHFQGMYFRTDIANKANCKVIEMDTKV
ncbi:MAG: phosphoribosylamine--glycine ligase [Chlamydiota bacterium]|nr:phosphoribosylamine--glycine ligase [Chlamydiota bacterium]